MPLARRVPKRGFYHPRREYALVNIEQLNRFGAGERVTPKDLKKMRLVKKSKNLVKILGKGELTGKGLEVTAHAFSQGAIHKIEAAGGKVEVLDHA